MTSRAIEPGTIRLAELQATSLRAERVGDVVTSLALGVALRNALVQRRTEQVAKRRLSMRRRTTTPL